MQPSWFFSQGGLYSTVGDLSKWNEALDTEKLVTRESLDHMFAPHVARDSGAYGYGWFIDTLRGHRVHWHTGGAPGRASYNANYPEDHITIVVLSNLETVGVIALGQKLGDDVLSLQGDIQ